MTVYIPFWFIIAMLFVMPIPFGMWLENKGDVLTGLFIAFGCWMLALGLSIGKVLSLCGVW